MSYYEKLIFLIVIGERRTYGEQRGMAVSDRVGVPG